LSETAETLSDGLPDFVLKTVPEGLERVAADLVSTGDWQVTALLYCGVLHGRFVGHVREGSADIWKTKLRRLFEEWQPIVAAKGGDVQSRHLHRESIGEPESGWLRTFAEELERR
jgi:hypothetical protein